MRKLKIFLGRYPRVRIFQRRIRSWFRRAPLVGRLFAALEYRLVAPHTSERYRVDDPADAHEYFDAYAAWILPRISGGHSVDIGCGYGFLTAAIADRPNVSQVIGVDKIPPDEFLFNIHPRIHYIQEDITQIRNFSGMFDSAISTECIEHISREAGDRLVDAIARHLHPAGVFLGSTPLGASISPFHEHEYTLTDLEQLLKRYFHSVRIEILPVGCLVWEAKEPRTLARNT